MSDYGSSQRRLSGAAGPPASDDSATARAKPGEIVPPSGAADHTVISGQPPLPPLKAGAHPSELGEKLEGERLGHFELREFIGGGGMGAVFRAIDTMLNRTVAVKVLSSHQAGDEETIRRFKNEAQSAARLDHENIARVYYVGEDRDVHYIVFEHIEGVNLRDLVARGGPLDLADAVSYTIQIAEALSHASQRDVVHRDIKPSNVLVTPEGRAKLVDMGLARLHQVEHADNDLTASGVTLGTFDYISPEQARDPRTADARSDLYSLGCTLYFMLTARPPFPEGTVLQKLLKHQIDAAPDPRRFRPDLPDELARVVAQLLEKDPDARYQTPGALAEELIALGERFGFLAPGRESPARAGMRRRGPSLLLRAAPWAVPAALLLAGVGLLKVLWSGSEELVALPEIRHVEPAEAPANSTAGDSEAEDQSATGGTEPVPPQQSDEEAAPPEPGASSEPPPGSARLTPRHALRTRLASLAGGESLRPDPLAAALGAAPAGLGLALAYPAAAPPASLGVAELPPPPTAAGDAPMENPMRRMGPLIVAPDGDGSAYPSLRAACEAAQSGDIIELRYDGPLIEKPIQLVDKRLTIRAGDGFRPRVVFQPGSEAVEPAEYPRSMFSLAGGELTLINLPIALDVPRDVAADHWTLIETRGGQTVSIRRCLLTIRNAEGSAAYHPNVTFIDLAAAPGGAMPMSAAAAERAEPVALRVKDTIVRGEATFVRSAAMQPLDLTWENGLLATTERLAEFQSGPAGDAAVAPMRVSLQHLTADVRRGLLRATNSEDAPRALDVKIKCVDGIILAGEDAALVAQDGIDRVETFQSQFTWSGDRNFYEGFRLFWKIGGGVAPYEPLEMELAEWRQFWQDHPDGDENRPLQGVVIWAGLPPRELPMHARAPADYALSARGVENPAHGAASDAYDVGFRLDLLPVELLAR